MDEATLTRLKVIVERAVRPVPVMSFAVRLAVMGDIQRSLWEVVPLLPHGVLLPVVLVAVAYLIDSECRHDREWARLEID
jgi:hypothetical protein